MARQSARNAKTNTSRVGKKKWCYIKLEQKLKKLYRRRKRKLSRRKKQTNAASGKLWKTHDHFWAKSKIDERTRKHKATDEEPAMTKEERVRGIGERTATSATLLATIPRVAVKGIPCHFVFCTLRR